MHAEGDLSLTMLALISSLALSANWLLPLLMVVGVIVLGLLAGVLLRARSAQAGSVRNFETAALQQAEGARQQIEDVRSRVAELIGVAQRLSARLDEKMAKLEELLVLAEQRLVLIDRATAATTRQQTEISVLRNSLAAAVEAKPEEARQSAPIEPDPATKAIYQLADLGRPPVEIARELNEQVGKVELVLALRAM